jgi:hypothetical protein
VIKDIVILLIKVLAEIVIKVQLAVNVIKEPVLVVTKDIVQVQTLDHVLSVIKDIVVPET